MDLDLLTDPDTYVSLLTLTAMEVVLGIDNIVFISLLSGKLPPSEQAKARRLGLSLALILRLGLLAALSWIMRLTTPLFTAFGLGFSGRHLILLAGGAFLVPNRHMKSMRGSRSKRAKGARVRLALRSD